MDNDGYLDLSVQGSYDDSSSPVMFYWQFPGFRADERERRAVWDAIKTSISPGEAPLVLDRSGQYVVATQDYFGDELRLWELRTMDYLRSVALPGPPAGFPAIRNWGYIHAAGDTDGDGYGDLVFHTGVTDYNQIPPVDYGVEGLLDGRTLQARWLSYQLELYLILTHDPVFSSPLSDINGDGVCDPIFAEFQKAGPWIWRALSGADGSELWRFEDVNTQGWPLDRYTAMIDDLDQDGILDVLIQQPPWYLQHEGYLAALSGSSGSVLWTNPIGQYSPCLFDPSCDKTIVPSRNQGSLGDADRDGYPDVFVVTDEVLSLSPYSLDRKVWVFSGKDGALLGRESMPITLEPWSPDALLYFNWWGGYVPLGDTDRDGWCELAVPPFAPSYGPGSSYLVVLGRRTLFAPETAHFGERIRLGVDMPGAAGLPFRILLSAGFATAEQDLDAGRFNTHLAPTRLTHLTWGAVKLAGMVGPQGEGSVEFRVPFLPSLAGQTLYAVAVVEDSSVPGGVRTISSLARIRILP